MRLLQLELWTDFESAGGVRSLIIPTAQVFAATRRRDLKGSDDLTVTIDAALSSLFGGSFGLATAAVITKTSSGLVFRDDFQRANSDTVGNSWNERESLAADNRILNNELSQRGTSSWIWRTEASHPNEFIVQSIRVADTADGDQLVGRAGGFIGSTFGTDLYRVIERTSNNDQRLFRSLSGASSLLATQSVTQLTGQFWQARLTGRTEGVDFRLRTYLTQLTGFGDTTTVPVERISFLDAAANVPPAGTQIAVVEADANHLRKDVVLLMGIDVTMTSLPTGFKVAIDGGPKAVENLGTATVPAEALTLPGVELQIFDQFDAPRGTFRPSDAIHGGDAYDFVSAAVDATFIPGSERQVLRAIFENVAKPGFAGAVQEWRIT